ncbi:hypothetical protein HX881_03795 [Pseudomonas gingeri]|uniref:hypothetical protein n=1 Tax=Pseudomonas gingeri TaxID=117681 RepID=UPI0015A4D965|nr:hypothetical protein [Pseudomonas gingeri]NVZ24660.1 hypothetical protein [Pseudomonas gingeri]
MDIFKPVALGKNSSGEVEFEDSRVAPISNMLHAYIPYRDGAATNKATLSSVALGGAGVAAIGLATDSHTDLYKSSAAIIATAFGLESWGNFKGQFNIYNGAVSYLACVKTYTLTIVDNSDVSEFQRAVNQLRSSSGNISSAYGVGVGNAAVESMGDVPEKSLVDASKYSLPDGSGSVIPTLKQAVSANALAEAEVADIVKAGEIVAHHKNRVLADMTDLQERVSKAISDSSFDTKKSVIEIAPKLSVPSSLGSGDAQSLINSQEVSSTLGKAHAIIDAYNSYQLCSTKLEVQTK